MKPREFWIEFEGDPYRDHQFVKRYVYGQEFEPNHLSSEVIHVREVMPYEIVSDGRERKLKELIKTYASYMKTANYHQMSDAMLKDLEKINSGEEVPK